MPLYDLNATLLGSIRSTIGVERLQPLHLGGAQGLAGGVGGPPGGFIGTLPQWKVSYDQSEQGTFATLGSGIAPSGIIWPSGVYTSWPSGIPSLWDNLNHIRARITVLETTCSGVTASGISAINIERNSTFEGEGSTLNLIEGANIAIAVTDMGDTVDIQFDCTASGNGTDELVKVSANDTVARYLGEKITAATGPISVTEINDGADEDLEIDWAWGNIVTVMKSGGDYTTVTAALAAITTASSSNRYLILVGPDHGWEQVTLKSYVDIAGFGIYNAVEGSSSLVVKGSPTDVSIFNMTLAHPAPINGIDNPILLSGGNVDFHHCRVLVDCLDLVFADVVYITGGTHRFFDCEIFNDYKGYPTRGGNAVTITGGTVSFFGGYIKANGSYVASSVNNGIYLGGGTLNIHQGTVIIGNGGKAINNVSGTVNVYSAEYDPDDTAGVITGADKDLVVGDLVVLDDARINTINEKTPTAGVAVDGLAIKDGGLLSDWGVVLTVADLMRGWKDDFLGDSLHEQYTNVINLGVIDLRDAEHGGAVRLRAWAGVGSWVRLWLGDAAGGYDTLDADEGWIQIARVRHFDNASCTMVFGACDSTTSVDRIWAGNISGTWRLRCTSAGATTTIDSGIAVDTTAYHWHVLKVFPIIGGRQADYYLDGDLIASCTTDVPTVFITPIWYVYNNDAADAKEVFLDFWGVMPRNLA